jgi:peptidoglycan hydrolase-like protein with peptidoglycan-binding domain
VTGGFYSQTFASVQAFQSKYGINATGYVGPMTRAKLNALYSK